MLRTLTYRILSATDGQTILHYLKSLGYSGPILVHLKKTDHGTLLNGVWAHMNETLHTGDLLCLHLEENTSGTSIFPQQIPLAICYEDEDLLVIDKPAGMPVHPSAAHQIRVHMSALGYPLAGDRLYYPAFSDTKIKRQALHSHRLSFSHPVTGEMLTFTSPLPCDMAALIDPEPSAHRGSSLPAVLRG